MSAASHGARTAPPAPRALVIAAFASLYVIWGSTYLAIRIAIETLPPFLMAGTRFLAAGAILYALARARGAAVPTRSHWRSATIIGALLLMISNGSVVWAETRVPSGITSLLVTTVPLWMVLIHWARRDGERPRLGVAAGIVLGLVGVAFLIEPGTGGESLDPLGAIVLCIAPIAWAWGSIWSRHADLPESPILAIGMEMLAGGALLLLLGLVVGESAQVHVAAISARSVAAWAYLTVFGALVGFTAYLWLLQVSTPAKVSTYAFVNPVVAVFLGWAFANETVTPRTLIAAAAIIGAVALITFTRSEPE